MKVTNVDCGSVFLESSVTGFQPDELTVPANTTYKEGTILARSSATEKLVAFVDGGVTAENGIPKTVLSYDVENDTSAPLDVPVRVAVEGKVRKPRLRIHPAITDAGVTRVIEDQLRVYKIIPTNTSDLSMLDNQ